MGIIADRQYEKEFQIRHRMPRPVSRSYESVMFSTVREDMENRIVWCANVAIRFFSALRQASYLAMNPGIPVNPPSFTDFKMDCENFCFPEGLDVAATAPLAQLAGVYSDKPFGIDKLALRRALSKLIFLNRYHVLIVEQEGFRVVKGPRIEYMVWNTSHDEVLREVPVSTVLYVDSETGKYISLDPLMIWNRDVRQSFGNLYILRRVAGSRGYYVEDGIPGSRGQVREVSGNPVHGTLSLTDEVRRKLFDSPGRFQDGSALEDKYNVLGVVWRGGTSDIYIARRSDTRELVALKTFENEVAGFDDNYWRFLDEERNTRVLQHEQIIKPEKVLLNEHGLMFEQELVQRGSLHDLIEYNGVLSAQTGVDITLQILEVLYEVHTSGLAHNDIKPDNILFDNKGRVRLIDFGIAFKFDEQKHQLRPGTLVGSVGYMAPEFREGVFPSVQSDLYSVGVVLAEMLSGEVVPSLEALHEVKAIPRKLYVFLERCMEADPGKRFSSAMEARDALGEIRITPEIAITLDVEGTLVTNYNDRSPRPGLYEFLSFIMSKFDRIFVYTMLDEESTAEVFRDLVERKAIPALFPEMYEYIRWVRGEDGSIKDLRRCKIPLEYNAIVDDMKVMIPEDQAHRWIPVPDYNYARSLDGGLLIAKGELLKKFNLD
ncbi:MAG TPA: serine/threonine-protein kinase [Spirochaetota bacterium]|nr:serine/threonine-protein kinase [Spirochaetota bacterium]